MDVVIEVLFFACVYVAGMGAGFYVGDTRGRWKTMIRLIVISLVLFLSATLLTSLQRGGIIQ